jgi:hypothetical protein
MFRQLKDTSPHLADTVSVMFEQQKHDTKNGILTHHCMDDNFLCPVKIWSKIVQRLISYPSSNPETTVKTYLHQDGSKLLFTVPHLLKRIRLAAATIGPKNLATLKPTWPPLS